MKLEDYLNQNVELKLRDNSSEQYLSDIERETFEEKLATDQLTIEIPPYLIDDSEAVGYPTDEFQQEIYDWVLEYVPSFTIKTVKDFGCGRGDFGKHFFPNYYTGIDLNKIIISAGRTKYPPFNLMCADYLKCSLQTDYTVCIGTLNSFVGIEKWEWFEQTLKIALDTTNEAIVFILSKNTEVDGYLDYPISETISRIPTELPFKIDYTKFEDIYALVVYKQPYS